MRCRAIRLSQLVNGDLSPDRYLITDLERYEELLTPLLAQKNAITRRIEEIAALEGEALLKAHRKSRRLIGARPSWR